MDKVMVDNYIAKYCVKKLSLFLIHLRYSHVYQALLDASDNKSFSYSSTQLYAIFSLQNDHLTYPLCLHICIIFYAAPNNKNTFKLSHISSYLKIFRPGSFGQIQGGDSRVTMENILDKIFYKSIHNYPKNPPSTPKTPSLGKYT